MEKSLYVQTMDEIEKRVGMLAHYGLGLETQLMQNRGNPIHSISEWKGELSYYNFETSINPVMRSIYEAQTFDIGGEYCIQQSRKRTLNPCLEPPSEGEESITQESEFQPSFKWTASRLIDSTLLKYDTPQPQKVNYDNVPQKWKNCKDLILFNIQKSIFLKQSNDSCFNYFKGRLEKFADRLKLRKCQLIYHKGKQALLIRFRNQESAQFAHFNMVRGINIYKQHFGKDAQIGRVTQNKIRQKTGSWVAMVFRKLPLNITKDNLVILLKKAQIKVIWVEQIIEINDWKYALVGVETLEDVFKTAQYFRNTSSFRELKQLKVNLHPHSKKIWNVDQTQQQ